MVRGRSASAVVLGAIGGVFTIGLWWLTIVVFGIEPYVAPTPPEVLSAFKRLPGYLLDNTWVTFLEVVQGFGITIVLGLLIGALLASSRTVEQLLMPSLVALNAIPKLAFAPLLLIWMGFGQGPKVVMVVLLCFFPVVLSVATGLTRTPADLAELTRALDASGWQAFVKVRLPSALPQIFVGLKVAMPLAVIGALVGELFGASAGLGYVIQNASSDTALAFAAIVLVAIMSIVLFYVLVAVERLLLPWVRETTA
ncbi:ABC transporter permease [Micromonospora sp. CPCC 205371]|nr:ABC transporter permease [Micromonospora sp. CPCC 205371]